LNNITLIVFYLKKKKNNNNLKEILKMDPFNTDLCMPIVDAIDNKKVSELMQKVNRN